jgi:hypothetical protein
MCPNTSIQQSRTPASAHTLGPVKMPSDVTAGTEGKLGATTGCRWPAPAVDMGAVTVNGPEGQVRDQDAAGWDAIDWRSCEEHARRLRQRIFKAAREQDCPKVRNLQKQPATPSRLA